MPSTMRRSGLADFGRPGSYVARQISRWGKQYKASETETIEAMDKLLDWLPAHLPANDETVLVHGDYRLDNMIFHAERAAGAWHHRLGDLDAGRSAGRALLSLHAVAHAQGLGRPRAATISQRSACRPSSEMVAYYCGLSKRAVPDPALWEFYMAYNLFRVSCIRQGVYARSLDGTASNVRAADSGKLVRPAAELGWKIVESIGGGTR